MFRMFRFMVVMAVVLFLAVSPLGAAPASKAEIARAKALAEQGWRIFNPPDDLNWGRVYFPDEPYYEYDCDRPEAAAELFRRAAGLNPADSEAWRGWGLALEASGPCSFNGLTRNWLKLAGLEPDAAVPNYMNLLNPPSPAAVLNLAGDNFKRAVEADPENALTRVAWGLNLIKRSQLLTEAGQRRALVAEAQDQFKKALELQPDQPDYLFDWINGLVLALATEPQEAEWSSLLVQLETLTNRLAPLLPEKPENFSWTRERKLRSQSDAFSRITARLMLAGWAVKEPEKSRALFEAVLKMRMRQMETAPGRGEPFSSSLGRLYLELLKFADGEREWNDRLAQALAAFEKGRDSDEGGPEWTVSAYNAFLRATESQNDPARRETLALAALKTIEEQRDHLKRPLLLNYFWQPYNVNLGVQARELFDWNSALYRVAGALPAGRAKNELIARADQGFQRGLELTELKSVYWQHWGQGLLFLARQENEAAGFAALFERAEGNQRLAAGADPDPASVWRNWAQELSRLTVKDKPDRQLLLLEKALAARRLAAETDPLARPDALALADLYFQLSRLYELNDQPEPARLSLDKALSFYADASESSPQGLRQGYPYQAAHFRQALVLASISNGGRDRDRLAEAMAAFRVYFSRLPQQAEIFGLNEPGRYLEPPDAAALAQLTATPFQFPISELTAYNFQSIYQALNPPEMTPWGLLRLADLHRRVAGTGLVSAEYQALYLLRAEKLLRQALTAPPSAAEPGEKETRRWDTDLVDRPLIMSELALVLLERNRLAGADGDPAGPAEAETLWREAEELVPGGSRYARARWAAGRGDREEMLKYLRHTYGEAALGLFPPLKEAATEPAFGPYKNEDWFIKTWYGVDSGGGR